MLHGHTMSYSTQHVPLASGNLPGAYPCRMTEPQCGNAMPTRFTPHQGPKRGLPPGPGEDAMAASIVYRPLTS